MSNTFWVHRSAGFIMGNLSSRSGSVPAIIGCDVVAIVSSHSPHWTRPVGWTQIATLTGFGGNNTISVLKRTAEAEIVTFNVSGWSWGAGTVLLISLTNTVDLNVIESFDTTDESDHVVVPDKDPGQAILWALCTRGNTGQNAHQLWDITPNDILQYISTHAAQGGGVGMRSTVAVDRGRGAATGRIFRPLDVTTTLFGVIMLEVIPTGTGLIPPWVLEPSVLGGYPHPNGTDKNLLDLQVPFRFHLSDLDFIGWKIETDTLGRYPFVFFRELEPPPPPPPPLAEITDIILNVPGRYVGSETDVIVTLGLQNVLDGDGITIQLYRAGAVYYDYSAILSASAETFSHTIPADIFVGLAVGSFVMRVELCRDDATIYVAGASYDVVPAPSVAFDIIEPWEIQQPITTPRTISSRWIMTGEGISRIQGSATLGGLPSTSFDLANQIFYVVFQNVTNLTVGSHSIAINLTITSDRYGTATASAARDNVLTVLPPIPDAEIIGVNLSVSGRYVGNALPIIVSANLANIRDEDSLTIRLRQGTAIFYEHSTILSDGVTDYSHTIEQSVIAGLDVGSYTIQVILIRDATTRDTVIATYRVVAAPTVRLLYVIPSAIQLPMAQLETINITFQVAGDGINTITGTITLDDTGFANNVNATATLFDVQLVGLTELAPRGYSVIANLSITSNVYGTVAISEGFNNVFRVLAEVIPIQRDLRSNALYIYNHFTIVQIIRNYVSLKWIRRYNRSGEFTLTLTNTPENAALAQTGFIVAKDNDDEAGFIEDVVIGEQIEIKGAFISKMLSFRVVNFTSEHLVNLQATADQLIMEHYIDTTPDRIIPGLRIADYTISTQFVLARIENSNLESWLENQDIGFKVAFLPEEEAFEFSLFDGRLAAAEFCENFRNITDQQYFNQTAQARNVVIVEGPPITNEWTDEPIRNLVTVGSAQGLSRREAYARAGRFPMFDFGHQFLRQNEPVESLDVKIIDPYTPFEYMRDYDIGDIVTIISESKDVTITQNIMEISEYYNKTGFHIYAIFGRVPRNLLMELRDNNYRLDDLMNNPEPPPLDLELIKDLIIPPLLEEIFDLIEFPPLPDWLYPWENFREWVEQASNMVLDTRLRPEVIKILEEILPGIIGGHSGHIILDRLPTQAQINSFPDGAVVVVYNPNIVFTPVS